MATTISGSSGREDLHRLLTQFVENKIRMRAHELYERRGRLDGHALDDWLKSESEVWDQAKSAGKSSFLGSANISRRQR